MRQITTLGNAQASHAVIMTINASESTSHEWRWWPPRSRLIVVAVPHMLSWLTNVFAQGGGFERRSATTNLRLTTGFHWNTNGHPDIGVAVEQVKQTRSIVTIPGPLVHGILVDGDISNQ